MGKRSLPVFIFFILFALILSSCSQEIEHVHNYSQAWSFDSSYHWHSCSCGEKSDYAEHLWGDVTSDTDGKFFVACQQCGYKKNVEPPCAVRFVVGFGYPDQFRTVKCGQALPEPDENPGDQFTGFRFYWWSLSQSGDPFDFSTPITSDTTLYAVYRQLFTQVFVDRGNITNQPVAYGEWLVPNNNERVNEGYTLAYWSLDNANNHGINEVHFPIQVTSGNTYYANWRKNINVNFYNKDPETDEIKGTLTQNAVEGYSTIPLSVDATGYKLDGWSQTGSANNMFDFSQPVGTQDIDLYPVWSTKEYDVWLLSDLWENPIKTSVGYKQKVVQPDDPEIEGFTFRGWKHLTGVDENDDLILSDYDFDTIITEDFLSLTDEDGLFLALYAVFERNTCTVSFDSGCDSKYEPQEVMYYYSADEPAAPVREGYQFLGWYLGDELYSFNTPIIENINLKAKWEKNQYTVIFDSNGGTCVTSQTVAFQDKAIKPEDPAKATFTFAGWFLEDKAFDFATEIESNITLKARWELNKYTVQIVSNVDVVSSQTVEHGSRAVEHEPGIRTGYHISESMPWYTGTENNKVAFSFDNQITGDTTVYANWEINRYAVDIYSNGQKISCQTVSHGSNAEEVSPERTGYHLSESMPWYTGTENNKVAFSFDSQITCDTIVYANWEINTYVISFDSNGGSDVEEQIINYCDNAIDPLPPIKTGYRLSYWAERGDLAVPYSFESAVTEDIELVAVWNEYYIQLRFHLSDELLKTLSVQEGSVISKSDLPEVPKYMDNWELKNWQTLECDILDITVPQMYSSDYYAVYYSLADCYSVNNGSFSLNDSIFAKQNGNVSEFIIPEEINGYEITSIASNAFQNCSSLTSITIPESVESIGSNAFCGCSGLEELIVEDGNEYYSSHSGVLYDVNQTTLVAFPRGIAGEFVIPTGVTRIGDNAFYNCSSLTSITIPDSVTSVGNCAFYGCSGLTSLTIPECVTSIGSLALQNCSGLTGITIPFVGESSTSDSSLIYIFGAYVPSSLRTIVITSATIIGQNAFQTCSGLTSITIPSGVTSIGDRAFLNCSGLTSITIPDSVISIGNAAFSGCRGLISIIIPESVTSIGNAAFQSCSKLTSLTIPDSVTSIGYAAFDGCSGLTSMTIPFVGGSSTSNSFLGYIFGDITNASVPSSLREVVVTSATSIGHTEFSGCNRLTSITIPASVTSIESSAFYNCSRLKNLIVEDGNEYYSSHSGVLYDVNQTTLVAFPRGIAGEFVIPTGVTRIGDNAFYNCSSLTSITIPDSVTNIGNCAFYGCSGLTSITIPSSVTSIGGWAFENCSGLTSITIPDSVISIGNAAFSGCRGLTSIIIPESVTSIGNGVFYGCSSLTSITIPQSVTSIGSNAFQNCSGLTSIKIPDSVTSIGGSAFYGCSGLTSITIPYVGGSSTSNWFLGYIFGANNAESQNASVPSSLREVKITSATKIGDYAFYGCSRLTSITIPASVNSIDYRAFYGCSGLQQVLYLGTEKQWDSIGGDGKPSKTIVVFNN